MGLDFRLRDFAHPAAIILLKRRFEREQWLPREQLLQLQLVRARNMVAYAYRHVPYYKELLRRIDVNPSDLRTLEDFTRIPCLTKTELQSSFSSLIARNSRRYGARALATSGTTGGYVQFLIDKPSNVLEFSYYWRFWGWAGYRMGDTFAELSAQAFTPFRHHRNELYRLERVTRRVLINSLLLSRERASDYLRLFRRLGPRFLKGLPSNLHVLALLMGEHQQHGIRFNAVFSQGETLFPRQRKTIEQAFACKVFDSYGHMERTAAVSQCPFGSYHVHTDYGLLELEDAPELPSFEPGCSVKRIIGTSLHNLSMPLLRYRTDDHALVADHPLPCRCGRGFPTLVGVLGRESDVVVTPEGRAVTALYVALDRTPGVMGGQVVQRSLDSLLLRAVFADGGSRESRRLLEHNVRAFVGESIGIEVVPVGVEELAGPGKFRSIISNVAIAELVK